MGRYVSQPLTVKCETIGDIRGFLSGCKYVSDQEQFGKRDYWQPPEEFERTKRGDCDCFALWTWRELLTLGYDARFVIGRAGRYGEVHAWVQFSKDGKDFLVEPTMARLGCAMPRLETLRYHPRLSVAWNGSNINFFTHEDRKREPPMWKLAAFIPGWLVFWIWIWVAVIVFFPFYVPLRIYKQFRSKSG